MEQDVMTAEQDPEPYSESFEWPVIEMGMEWLLDLAENEPWIAEETEL